MRLSINSRPSCRPSASSAKPACGYGGGPRSDCPARLDRGAPARRGTRCGIGGTFRYGEGAPAGVEVMRRMTDRIAHRGPDDDGMYSDADVTLGFRRLSIIDLTTGHQPIHNEDKSV